MTSPEQLHPDSHRMPPGFSDPQHRLLAGISWNLAVLANEVKRVADVLENEVKRGGALDHRPLHDLDRIASVLGSQPR